MKNIVMVLVVGVVVCGIEATAGNYDIVEFPIYTGNGGQSHPVIDGDTVAWIDADFGNGPSGPVHYKNLSTGQDHVIATSLTCTWWGWSPAIDGDNIIWSDTATMGIYGYNISTQTDYVVWSDGKQRPGIDIVGNTVFGVEHKGSDDYDIYGYDTSAGTRFPISTAPSYQYNPVTNGDVVVWGDLRNGGKNWDIYGFDLASETEFEICTQDIAQQYPSISGNIVVWSDSRNRNNNSNEDIYGYNLDTQAEFQITTNIGLQEFPSISDNFVVWMDNRNGDYDIYGYDLLTQTEFPIATGLGDQLRPSISGNTVVWESDGDIFGATIPEPCSLLLIGFGGLFLRKRTS
ncbi:MAG: hypothetical protein ABIG61_16035 [Planctomycetota bacterium]